jgi:hypothetical protein
MVSDQQARRLWRSSEEKLSLDIAAAKAGMDPKTARNIPAKTPPADYDGLREE